MVSQRPTKGSASNFRKQKKRKQEVKEKRIHKHKKRQKEEEQKGRGRSGERSGVQWQSAASQAIWLSALLDSELGASLSQLERAPPLSGQLLCFLFRHVCFFGKSLFLSVTLPDMHPLALVYVHTV